MKRKSFLGLFLFLIGLLILGLLVWRLGVEQIFSALQDTNLFLLFIGVAVYSLSILTRGLKWYIILKNPDTSFLHFLCLYTLNAMIAAITPARSGELFLSPFLFRNRLKVSLNRMGSVVLLDRFFELTFLVFFMMLSLVSLLLVKTMPPLVLDSVIAGTIVLIVALLFLILILRFTSTFIFILSFFLGYCGKNGFCFSALSFAIHELTIFKGALHEYSGRRIFGICTILTAVSWLFHVAGFYIIMISIVFLPFPLFAAAIFIAIGVGFASFIPLSLGTGTITFTYMLSLFGYDKVRTTAGWLLVTGFSLIGLMAFSLASFFYLRKRSRL